MIGVNKQKINEDNIVTSMTLIDKNNHIQIFFLVFNEKMDET